SRMQPVTTGLLLLLAAAFPVLKAEHHADPANPFSYNWHRLRVRGLIATGVLCTVGIIVLLSGKCKCKCNRKASRWPNEPPHLITPGSASNCCTSMVPVPGLTRGAGSLLGRPIPPPLPSGEWGGGEVF
ncbi:FXYD domain containing ion transport regulator 3, partial [Chelydra serpentina]